MPPAAPPVAASSASLPPDRYPFPVLLSDLIAGPQPHPDLVAATVPTSRDMLMAASVLGWLPENRWEPVVRA